MNAIDVRACDVEPIHIPGATQPHGVLVALDPLSLEITHISANCAALFSVPAESVIGRSFSALVGPTVAAQLGHPTEAATARAFEFETQSRSFDALVHRHQGVVIVEVEAHDPHAAVVDSALRTALARLQQHNSVRELCAIAVEAVRAFTGFDRVMLYRFGEDGHGDVVEESIAAGVVSYRGQRFPASDIPRQARQLYLLNWLRLIPDSAYQPVALLSKHAGAPLDLTFATLRSVAAVHLEYLQNMAVGASMSVSLVAANSLMGLIACHHRVPRHVSFAARAACEVLGRVVALQIAAQEELDAGAARDAIRGAEARLADAIRAGHDDIATALVLRSDLLLDLVDATGVAVCTGSEIRTAGNTPSTVQLVTLLSWLDKNNVTGVLHTDALASRHPEAAAHLGVASGLLAIVLPTVSPSYVLWFRPELIRTTIWAGNPEKPVAIGETSTHLHPRRSFDAWTEIVRGRSRPWQAAEIGAGESMRRLIIEVDLSTQITRAAKALLLRDEMVAIVSHDLKGPLQVVAMATALLREMVTGNAVELVARIERATGRMNTLIHDLLDLATIEAGRFEVARVPWPVSKLVADASTMLGALAEQKTQRLTWTIDGAPWVLADGDRIFQVLSNLVGNAIKYTPTGGSIEVSVREVDGSVRFAVRDSGLGIDPTGLFHIFDRYWQARRARGAGSGLGLYIAKGIVEAHGQRIWAESTPSAGATFYFTLAKVAAS